jgi:hypothetical protein
VWLIDTGRFRIVEVVRSKTAWDLLGVATTYTFYTATSTLSYILVYFNESVPNGAEWRRMGRHSIFPVNMAGKTDFVTSLVSSFARVNFPIPFHWLVFFRSDLPEICVEFNDRNIPELRENDTSANVWNIRYSISIILSLSSVQ